MSPAKRSATLRKELYRLQALINSRVRGDLTEVDLKHLLETLDLVIPHG